MLRFRDVWGCGGALYLLFCDCEEEYEPCLDD